MSWIWLDKAACNWSIVSPMIRCVRTSHRSDTLTTLGLGMVPIWDFVLATSLVSCLSIGVQIQVGFKFRVEYYLNSHNVHNAKIYWLAPAHQTPAKRCDSWPFATLCRNAIQHGQREPHSKTLARKPHYFYEKRCKVRSVEETLWFIVEKKRHDKYFSNTV